MHNGRVKKVISEKGFGFIAGEDGREYFFHRSGLDASVDFDRLAGGESVSFSIEPSPKGPRATAVRRALEMRPLPPAERPLRHVIAEYRHRAQTITCECGWHGSSLTNGTGMSDWRRHLISMGVRPR